MNDLPDVIERLEKSGSAGATRLLAGTSAGGALAEPGNRAKEGFCTADGRSYGVRTGEKHLSVLGIALLGIAGAYVLRALEQTGPLPRIAVAGAGIVYAFP